MVALVTASAGVQQKALSHGEHCVCPRYKEYPRSLHNLCLLPGLLVLTVTGVVASADLVLLVVLYLLQLLLELVLCDGPPPRQTLLDVVAVPVQLVVQPLV